MENHQEVKVIDEVPNVSVPVISEGYENGPMDTNTSSEVSIWLRFKKKVLKMKLKRTLN